MGLFDKFKKKVGQVTGDAFNVALVPAQQEMLNRYLLSPTWLNPNQENVFDAQWAWNHIIDFINAYCEASQKDEELPDYGIIRVLFKYNDSVFSINFAPHNPRVLKLKSANIVLNPNTGENGETIPYDGEVYERFLSMANQYNKLDSRHLVYVGTLSDGLTPYANISTHIIFTPEYGDKELIKNACDNLMEYIKGFMQNAYNDHLPDAELFNNNLFLPEQNITLDRSNRFNGRNNALEFWFNEHTTRTFGDIKLNETEEAYIGILPSVFNSRQTLKINGVFKTIDTINVALPIGENGSILSFSADEKNQIRLHIRKDNAYIYSIEAKNLKNLFQMSEDKKNSKSDEDIKEFCLYCNNQLNNQLVKCIWEKCPDGHLDFSLIATGLWVGESQSFAKIQCIGEFMKNLALAQWFFENDLNNLTTSDEFRHYLFLAKQNDAEAQQKVGFFYERGEGVAQNYAKALHWYELAAQQQEDYALNNLGWMYENGMGVKKDISKAIEYYSKAIEKGNPYACSNMASLYLRGEGVCADTSKAFELNLKGAEHGINKCEHQIALAYLTGDPVEQNMEEGFKWMLKAAQHGHVISQYNIGSFYIQGCGCEKNISQARHWLQIAHENGHPQAQELIESINAGKY